MAHIVNADVIYEAKTDTSPAAASSAPYGDHLTLTMTVNFLSDFAFQHARYMTHLLLTKSGCVSFSMTISYQREEDEVYFGGF